MGFDGLHAVDHGTGFGFRQQVQLRLRRTVYAPRIKGALIFFIPATC